jgi:pSer/pThr/pTyr-binding forkhead associated (FHA) protein
MSIKVKIIYPNKEDLVSFDLGISKVTIGRNPENDICLRDDILSGNHLTITNIAGRIFVRDLKSSNGTIINSTPVAKRTRLFLLDEIALGEGFYIALDRLGMSNKELIDNKRPHTGSQPLDIYTKEVCDINLDERYGEVKVLDEEEVHEEILLDFERLSEYADIIYYKVQYDEAEE